MAKVAIVCAIPVEFKETRKFLKDVREVAHPEGSIYDQGTFESPGQNWDVLLVEAGAGNAAAAMATQRAIDFFKPDVVLFVGVAGGLKDVKRGDVVAASQVFQYDKGKAADEFMPRPNAGTANYALSERAKAESRKDDPDWIKRLDLKEPLSDPLPKLYVGDIVAGEKVVTSDKSETAQILAKHFSNALAVEMEGIGFYSAIRLCGNSQLPGLLIRGISDMVTDKAQSDEDGWQPKAARNAAAVAFDILSKTSVRTTAAAAVVHSISGELSELRQKLLKQEMALSSAILILHGITQGLLPEDEREWLKHEMDGYTVEEVLALAKRSTDKLHTARVKTADLVLTHLQRGSHKMIFPDSSTKETFSLVMVTSSIEQIEYLTNAGAHVADIPLVPNMEERLRAHLMRDMAIEKGKEGAKEYVSMLEFKHQLPILAYTQIMSITRSHVLELIELAILKAGNN